MFAKLKGYFRRLSTPKKETNYQPEETSYGNIEVSYIGSVKIEGNVLKDNTNIILQISYEKNMKDANTDRENFIEMASTSNLNMIYLDSDELDKRFIFISGPVYKYDKLCVYGYDVKYSNNKTLMKVMSILEKIDLMQDSSTFKEALQDKYTFPYTSDDIYLTSENPVYVQCIDTYWIDKDIIDAGYDILDCLKDAFIVAILLKNQNMVMIDIIETFVKSYKDKWYQQYILDYIDEYKEAFASNFTIPGYKNIFDINFLVTSHNGEFEDIDEPLD